MSIQKKYFGLVIVGLENETNLFKKLLYDDSAKLNSAKSWLRSENRE